jgi:hypothetical protein
MEAIPMKKLFALLITAALLLGLTACFDSGQGKPTTALDTTPVQTTTAVPTTPAEQETETKAPNYSAAQGHSQKPLPTYVSGSIKLAPDVVIEADFEFTPTKRRLYYNIPGPFISLAQEGTLDELFEKNKDIYSEPQEMALATLVKYCNISRQDFNKAVDEYIKMCASAGFDMVEEQFEIPNADIIYVFDNEIINEYYRRA